MDGVIEESRSKWENLARDLKLKEKVKSHEVGDELKKICEAGGPASMAAVKSKKTEFQSELEKMRAGLKVRVQ